MIPSTAYHVSQKIRGLHGATLDLTPGSPPKIWLPFGSLGMALDLHSKVFISRLAGLYSRTDASIGSSPHAVIPNLDPPESPAYIVSP
ncbi:hypothetical protein VI817_000704 [Penicillium citrinum]|nr:hypothetical protein VI817_000704 [Penicillium citrinum]